MFGRSKSPYKPELKVISVRTEKRKFKDTDATNVIMDYNGYRSNDRYGSTIKTKEYDHNVTIVLLVRDGELCTKEFNGKWDLEEVKQWEEF